MKKCNRMTRRHGGFTLTELAMVMGVVGTIIGSVWMAQASARETQRGNDGVSEVQNVATNIMTMMAGQKLSTCATGVPTTVITSCMIAAQAIPSGYINSANNLLADDPWSPDGFVVNYIGNRTFRLSVYNVTRKGCMALLLGVTACQAGQPGCPTVAYTNYIANSLLPSATTGWQVMTPTAANLLCAANTYTANANSVEFDFAL